MLLYTNTGIGV